MKTVGIGVLIGISLLGSAAAQAQIQATERAAFHLPPSQTVAPNTPGGGVVVGSNVYEADGAQGFIHLMPADPANPDPVNSGILVYDPRIGSFTLGGGGVCMPFCKLGQLAYDGNQTVYVTSYDQQKGQPFSATFPGVNKLTIDPVNGYVSWNGPVAAFAGLQGNQTTSLALGPDGNLYVGFLKNGNVVRIVNPGIDPSSDPTHTIQIVQSVGGAPNGCPVRSLTFVGPDLYLGTAEGLSVIKNAIAETCLGGCNAVHISDGFGGVDHVGLTSDGINRIYMSINGVGVARFTINTQATQMISTGGIDATTGAPTTFGFVGGHSNMLFLDRLGNLWVGDDTSDGAANFSGRVWYISAGALSSIP